MTQGLRLLHPYDMVHLIMHKETQTHFAVHKNTLQRSMTYVTAFVDRGNALEIMKRMDAYKKSSGAWPNRILEDNTAYLWELHEEDEVDDELQYLELTTTQLGHLQRNLHYRNIALELIYTLNCRPSFGATVVTSTPRKDLRSYTPFLEHAYMLDPNCNGTIGDLNTSDDDGTWFSE